MNEDTRKEANDCYQKGESYLEVSCWKCQSKPSYLDAIPNLKRAADLYHGLRDYQEERKVRERLVYCFFSTKSFWEEANEYDKIAQILIKEMNKHDTGYNYVVNANKSYIAAKDYAEAVKTLTKFINLFIEIGNKNLAEKIGQLAYENVIKYYHILTMKKDDPTEYIYKAVDLYLDLIFNRKEVNTGIDLAEKLAKLIEKEDGDPYKLMHYYLLMSLGYIIIDHPTYFNFTIQKCKDLRTEKTIDDGGNINLVESINNDITEGNANEHDFNRHIVTLSYDFSNEIGKMLKQRFNGERNPNVDKIQKDDNVDIGNGMENGNKQTFLGDSDSDYK